MKRFTLNVAIISFILIIGAFTRPILKGKIENERLNRNEVWVNGKIPFTTSTDSLVKLLGQPDSITRPLYDCGGYVEGYEGVGDKVELYHYGNSRFVAYANSRADMMEIDFTSGKFALKVEKTLLDKNTTFVSFGKIFPESCASAYDWNNGGKGKTYKIVRVLPKGYEDDAWLFWFDNGLLVRAEYWISC